MECVVRVRGARGLTAKLTLPASSEARMPSLNVMLADKHSAGECNTIVSMRHK